MTLTATPTAPPDWMLQFMNEIDSLEFGEGFARLTDETEFYFGTARVVGVEAIKAFIVKIDGPLNVHHEIVECWAAGNVYFAHGGNTMSKKSEPDKVVQGAPFMNIFYLDDGDPMWIKRIRVTAGPLETDAIL